MSRSRGTARRPQLTTQRVPEPESCDYVGQLVALYHHQIIYLFGSLNLTVLR